MITVHLDSIRPTDPDRRYIRRDAILWLAKQWPDQERWIIKDLSFIEFENDADATFFLMKWS